jgi:outer membrane protein assembly factor BamB
MRRSLVAVVAVAVLLIIAGSIYIVGPPLLKGNSGSNAASSTVSVSGSVSTSSKGASSTGDWTTYHVDNARTGYLSVSNFTAVTNGWTSPALDGNIYAEPLVYRGDVFVATENNSVYALDGKTGSPLWQRNLGPPVQANTLPCGDIGPITGITGTPVIDPSTGILYVVSYSAMHHTLSALNVSTGVVLFQELATPPGFNDTTQQERTALTLANGMVYIGYGGLAGDCAQYYGWEVGLPANAPGKMVYYQVPVTREGAIWAPSGAAVDPSGNVYVTTGNGASTTTFDHSDSVIKLSPTLTEEGYFAPTNWLQLNQNDGDLGSLAPAFVGPNLIFQIGKQGVGYLLNASQLGGIGGETFSANVCDESFGGTAYSSPIIFVPCINGLFELQVANGTFSTKLEVTGSNTTGFNAGPPTVTDGVVWTVDSNTGTLYGLRASDGHQEYTFSLGAVEHFTSPSAGDGRLFVAATNVVESFVLG